MKMFTELQKHREILEFCGKCGDCASSGTQITTAKRHVSKPCPVKNVLGFEAYDARGRILILKNLLNDKLKIDESILRWAYTCTSCGSCKETCLAIEGGIDTPILMESLKQDLVTNDIKLDKHLQVLNSILKQNNPYNEPNDKRFDFLNCQKFTPDAEYLLFLGCTASFRQQNIALATTELLDNLGINYSILKDEACCGSILKRYGYIDEFKEIAKKNIKSFEEKKIKKIIFPCAGCYRTFKIDYAEVVNSSIQFYHLSEFLDQYLKENFFNFKLRNFKKISYHDPCHLGRHSGVYEAPRGILKKIKNSNFIELDALRNYSHCCGAGGGVKSSEPNLAQKIASNRNQEAIEKGIEILVSACPFCEKNLKDGLPDNGIDFEILDISEILIRSFQKELSSKICKPEVSEGISKKYMDFLAKYPEIFSDLVNGSILDFAIYDTLDSLEEERPFDCFNVLRNEDGIEIKQGKADDPDLELAVSTIAVEKLIQNQTKLDYAKQFGIFYNEPDEEEGWIDFILHKRTKTLIKMGYGKFAEEAGILEDEDDI